MTTALWLIVLAGALSIVYGIVTTRGLLAADAGTERELRRRASRGGHRRRCLEIE